MSRRRCPYCGASRIHKDRYTDKGAAKYHCLNCGRYFNDLTNGPIKRRYDSKTEIKPIYGIVTVEMCGRAGEFNVLAEPEGAQPLVGQIILEQLDLVVDPSTRKVIPNPRSPEMPMVEILMATPPNSGHAVRLHSPKPIRASHTRNTLSASLKRMMRNNT